MEIVEAAGHQRDGRVPDSAHIGPTVPRMVLGAQLRRLREARGITAEEASETIRASHSKISRLERGRTGFKQRDVADLLTLYGVTDEAERATLLAMAKQAGMPGWWQPYQDVVSPWWQAYLELEQAAGVIRSYEPTFVPELLQTPDYARAVIRSLHHEAPKTEIARRVELRMKRQRILRRPDAPRLWTVIDEAALHRSVGGAATMRDQLRHLIDIAELPHVTVQVMPFSRGGHAATAGPITFLRFSEDALPDVVFLEQLTGGHYLDKAADIAYYWHVLNRLGVEAQPQAESRALLNDLLKDM
ncbi:helix-turn-helix domain-containing protein [Planotetraspora sp. A-T 1434]|uniref:helix-turn-helix domain-containing protein n=1 Tax=Planotetraspora sp. A-T 1434 TaxID=2979219 RepID=UPI0021C19AB7|nr:helix-turn-helix transcriptional regulator [Planotetraspora sp. A-T 1434]MCT9932287.1 helix-turn-helix domain-containing protein [Planotetraspora sp. A-T 1434]